MREGFLERDGVRLHWVEWAPAQPDEDDGVAILALHGLSSNALFWGRLAAHLPHRRVVALDQRTHGATDAPASGYRMEDLSADALFAVEALELGRPVLIGHSWGGSVALDLAATSADRLAGLGLIDSPILPLAERLSWDEAAQVMQPDLPRYARLEDAYPVTARILGEAWGADLEPFVAASHRRDGDAWVLTLTADVRLQILKQLFAFQPVLLFERLAGLPVLLALAGADAGFRPWKQQGARELQAAIPDADVRWHDSGHDIPLILPGAVAADVERLCLRAAWRELARDAATLQGDWDAPSGAGEWSAKDLLAHLSSSQAAMAPLLALGPPRPGGEPFDADRWNASQIRRRQDTPPADLIAEVARGTRALDAALLTADLDAPMPAGSEVGRSVASALRAMARHQRGHLDELRLALGSALGRPA